MLKYFQEMYDKQTAWDIVLYTILGCTLIGVTLLALTWKWKPKA